MAFPTVPVVIGSAVAVVIGLFFWSRKAAAADLKNKQPPDTAPKADTQGDFAAGCQEGTIHGAADGKIGVKNTRPQLNYNADATRQKFYEQGYYECYGKAYDAASALAGLTDPGDLYTKDAIPPDPEEKIGVPGGAKGGGTTTKKDAVDWYNIGMGTGRKNGEYDGKQAAMGKGSFGATPRPAPPTDDPVPRDAWSNGYERGYGDGFSAGMASVKTGRWPGGVADLLDEDGFVHPASHPSFVLRSLRVGYDPMDHGVARVGAWGVRSFALAGPRMRPSGLSVTSEARYLRDCYDRGVKAGKMHRAGKGPAFIADDSKDPCNQEFQRGFNVGATGPVGAGIVWGKEASYTP